MTFFVQTTSTSPASYCKLIWVLNGRCLNVFSAHVLSPSHLLPHLYSTSCLLSMVIYQANGWILWAGLHGPLLSAHISVKWKTPAHRLCWLALKDTGGSLPATFHQVPGQVWHCLSLILILYHSPGAWLDCQHYGLRLWRILDRGVLSKQSSVCLSITGQPGIARLKKQ